MMVVDSYLDMPGCCAICLGVATPVVDTLRDRDSDGYAHSGRMYVCVDCVTSLADLFGFAHPDRVERLEGEVAKAEADRAEAESLLEDALTALDNLGRVRARKTKTTARKRVEAPAVESVA